MSQAPSVPAQLVPKVIGWLAVVLLAVATIYYAIPVIGSPSSTAQAAPVPSSASASSGKAGNSQLAESHTAISANDCVVTDRGITATKQAAACTVTVDLQTYPFVRGMVGFCENLDTTSPANTSEKFVLSFKGSEPLLLRLSSARPENLPDSIKSVMVLSDTIASDCASLPADLN